MHGEINICNTVRGTFLGAVLFSGCGNYQRKPTTLPPPLPALANNITLGVNNQWRMPWDICQPQWQTDIAIVETRFHKASFDEDESTLYDNLSLQWDRAMRIHDPWNAETAAYALFRDYVKQSKNPTFQKIESMLSENDTKFWGMQNTAPDVIGVGWVYAIDNQEWKPRIAKNFKDLSFDQFIVRMAEKQLQAFALREIVKSLPEQTRQQQFELSQQLYAKSPARAAVTAITINAFLTFHDQTGLPFEKTDPQLHAAAKYLMCTGV